MPTTYTTTYTLIDAEILWRWHREALGGRSSVTGAELPQTLAGAPPGARLARAGSGLI